MIHGVYIKNKINSSWHLVSLTVSIESAKKDALVFREQSEKEGNENAEIIIKTFDSTFYIPEIMRDIKPQKIMYN